jgi:VanZ family protein
VGIFIKFWFPLLVYSGMIFYVSAIPSLETPSSLPHADKIFHAGVYFIYGLLASRAFAGTFPLSASNILARNAFLLMMCYAISDEFHQAFVPGRTASIGDIIADIGGGILGILFFQIFFIKSRKL